MWCAIIFYNDTLEFLRRAFESAGKAKLKIIAVDGAFERFPRLKGEPVFSTDGCKEYAEKHSHIFIKSPEKGWMDKWGGQPAKRTACFKAVGLGQYVLVLDADEVLESGAIIRPLQKEAYNVSLVNHNTSTAMTRVFKAYDDLIYAYSHNYVYRKTQMKGEQDIIAGLKYRGRILPFLKDDNGRPVVIKNFTHKRSQERQNQNTQYRMNRKEVSISGIKLEIDKSKKDLVTIMYIGNEVYNCPPWANGVTNGKTFKAPEYEWQRISNDYGLTQFRLA